MNRIAQNAVTAECMRRYENAVYEWHGDTTGYCGRLRTCKAQVYETEHYWLLVSYNTIVAVTSKETGICYDVLRIVYGYTATSAQHIAKFCHDYHTEEYTWGAPHWIAR